MSCGDPMSCPHCAPSIVPLCQMGRTLGYRFLRGWQDPCPHHSTATVLVKTSEDDPLVFLGFCDFHWKEMEATGVIN